jgi:hypothetical protein
MNMHIYIQGHAFCMKYIPTNLNSVIIVCAFIYISMYKLLNTYIYICMFTYEYAYMQKHMKHNPNSEIIVYALIGKI